MTWPLSLWRHPVMWHHRHHVQWITHRQVPISCPLEPSRFLASFARYLAPNLRRRLLRDNVMSDVISPWSATVRTMQTYYTVDHFVNARSNSDKNFRRRSILKKRSVTSPLWRHPVTWRHREHAQSIAHTQVPIGCTLKLSRYLATFLRYLSPKLRQWLYVMTSSVPS